MDLNFSALRAALQARWRAVIHALEKRLSPIRRDERQFLLLWSQTLADNAKVFIGLFTGLQKAAANESAHPEKVLKEWCMRTENRWEGQPLAQLTRHCLLPQAEASFNAKKWARLLLLAAERAGITPEARTRFVLDESHANDYLEWDGRDLYPGDTIEVLFPAWYQNGRLLETGTCRLLVEASS